MRHHRSCLWPDRDEVASADRARRNSEVRLDDNVEWRAERIRARELAHQDAGTGIPGDDMAIPDPSAKTAAKL